MAVSALSTKPNRWERMSAWIAERRFKVADAAVNIRRAFAIVWQSHPPSAMAMAVCTIIGALLPAGQAWVGKLIVDTVVTAVNTHIGAEAGLGQALPLLIAEFFLIILQAGNNQARTLAEHILHARLNLDINTRIIRKALELDLTYFENAEFYDKLQNARREADFRGLQIVNGGFYLIQNVITLVSFGALLLRFSPWLALILFVATIPAFIAQSRYAELSFRVLSWRAPEARKLSYLEYLLTDYDSVKEIRLLAWASHCSDDTRICFGNFSKKTKASRKNAVWHRLAGACSRRCRITRRMHGSFGARSAAQSR